MSEKEKEAIVEEQQQDISELLQIRRDKLAALQAEGNNPFFVNTCDKDISAQEIHDRFEELEGKDVCTDIFIASIYKKRIVPFCL